MWEWALTTRWASLVLPALAAVLVGTPALVAARAVAQKRARDLASRFDGARRRLADLESGPSVVLEGVLEATGDPILGIGSGEKRLVASASSVDGGETTLLAQATAAGLAIRLEDGAVALDGPVSIAWGDPEVTPRRVGSLARAARDRLLAAAPGLAESPVRSPIALRELAAGARVVALGTLATAEGGSYRADAQRVLRGDERDPVAIASARMPRPSARRVPALVVALLAAMLATVVPYGLLEQQWPEWYESPPWQPSALETLVFLTPRRREAVAHIHRSSPAPTAAAVRAWSLATAAYGDCDAAGQALACRGLPLDDLLRARCTPTPLARVAAARHDGRAGDADALASLPETVPALHRARLQVEAGEFAGAARAVAGDLGTCVATGLGIAAGDQPLTALEHRAHDEDVRCATMLFALDPARAGRLAPGEGPGSSLAAELALIDAPEHAPADEDGDWPSGRPLILGMPEVCDALCAAARRALEGGSARPRRHARMLLPALESALASGDAPSFEHDLALVTPHAPPLAVARLRAAWAIVWQDGEAARAAVAAIPRAADREDDAYDREYLAALANARGSEAQRDALVRARAATTADAWARSGSRAGSPRRARAAWSRRGTAGPNWRRARTSRASSSATSGCSCGCSSSGPSGRGSPSRASPPTRSSCAAWPASSGTRRGARTSTGGSPGTARSSRIDGARCSCA